LDALFTERARLTSRPAAVDVRLVAVEPMVEAMILNADEREQIARRRKTIPGIEAGLAERAAIAGATAAVDVALRIILDAIQTGWTETTIVAQRIAIP
jgi:hypothetical protein